MSMVGRTNIYRCVDCGGFTVTIDRDEGTTPMSLACRSTEGCKGSALSSMYPEEIPAHIPAPEWEWYRPDEREMLVMNAECFDHVSRGGLMLRPIEEPGQ